MKTLACIAILPALLAGCGDTTPPGDANTHTPEEAKERTATDANTQLPADANAVDISSLIRVEFDKPSYRFSQAQAASGVEIGYTITVTRDTPGLHPRTQKSASSPDANGLLPMAGIQGNGQRYWVWDFGLGAAQPVRFRTIPKGTTHHTLVWDGRNWQGPSDTNQPKGPPFPPGRYTVLVRMVGVRKTEDGQEPYEIKQTAELVLTE